MFDLPGGIRFPQDLIDILLVAFVIYNLFLLLKGTRAFRIMIGIGFLAVAYLGSQLFELFTIHWILNAFLSSFIIIVVILFQSDIRRLLARVGMAPFSSYKDVGSRGSYIVEEILKASIALANKNIGGLIVLERETALREHMEGGLRIEARLSRELLHAIFLPYSPIHDGAVVISGGKIMLAGCFLPLTTRSDLDKDIGTRHRAALGLTEETDAAVIVVSEETGGISVAINGRMTRDLDGHTLRRVLTRLFVPTDDAKTNKIKPKPSARKEEG